MTNIKSFQENAFQSHAFDEGTSDSIKEPVKSATHFGDSYFGAKDIGDKYQYQHIGSNFGGNK